MSIQEKCGSELVKVKLRVVARAARVTSLISWVDPRIIREQIKNKKIEHACNLLFALAIFFL
jgi:hypothetical protein